MEYLKEGEYKMIYLATDDEKNIALVRKFSSFTWKMQSSDGKISGLGNRHGSESFRRLIIDLYILSASDFFFGTDGSQISRMVYEMMQTRHLDATSKAWSIHTIVTQNKFGFYWYLI